MLASLLTALGLLLTDVERLHQTVEPPTEAARSRSSNEMMQVLEQRTAVIETTVLRLASDADQARRACPIPMMTRGC